VGYVYYSEFIEHNLAIHGGWLGLDEAEIAALKRNGVTKIPSRPVADLQLRIPFSFTRPIITRTWC